MTAVLPVIPTAILNAAKVPVSEASRRRSTSSIGSVLQRFFVKLDRKPNKIRGKIKHLTQGTWRSNTFFGPCSWHQTLEFSSFLCSKHSCPTTGLHGGRSAANVFCAGCLMVMQQWWNTGSNVVCERELLIRSTDIFLLA